MFNFLRWQCNLRWNFNIINYILYISNFYLNKQSLHSIETLILREAAGGTELFAMHSNTPEWVRDISFITSVFPSCIICSFDLWDLSWIWLKWWFDDWWFVIDERLRKYHETFGAGTPSAWQYRLIVEPSLMGPGDIVDFSSIIFGGTIKFSNNKKLLFLPFYFFKIIQY